MSQYCNIVILSVKHANSSITAKMLVAAGWERNDMNEDGESKSFIEQNRLLQAGKVGIPYRCFRILNSLKEPWVLKDPGFARTAPTWLPYFESYQPLLLYVTKDPRKVMQSYLRRSDPSWGRPYPITSESIQSWENRCQKQYDAWPWKKVKVRVDDMIKAMALFSVARSEGIEENVET